MTKVIALECPKCLDIIYSRARHDYHFCSCGHENSNPKGISIDGGFDYLNYGWANDLKREDVKILEIEIPFSKTELYTDWNYQINNHGLIKNKELMLSDWFWNNTNDLSNYEFFMSVYRLSDRSEIIEQIYCMEMYGNRKK